MLEGVAQEQLEPGAPGVQCKAMNLPMPIWDCRCCNTSKGDAMLICDAAERTFQLQWGPEYHSQELALQMKGRQRLNLQQKLAASQGGRGMWLPLCCSHTGSITPDALSGFETFC